MALRAFYNDRGDTVAEMLEALARTRAVRASRTDGVRCVVRAEIPDDAVAIVSGGGSGHEPAHAGLVGDGLLTAAVCGDFFASPTVEAVLATIREVTGAAGCLLVVKNYTGDRLNFGLAAERARAEGLAVEVVTVADDVALPDNDEPRGLAGTVLVHKVAGHLAREGADLATVARAARGVAAAVRTLSLSLSSALLPGQDGERRSAELGLGIHNESGARSIEPADAADAVRSVLEPLLDGFDAEHGADAPLVVLLNDTGGCATQELAVLTREVLAALGERVRLLVGPAALMTSVDMHGFSLTVLPWDERTAEALASPVGVPDWPAAVEPHPPAGFDAPVSPDPDWGAGAREESVAAGLRAAAEALVAAEGELDRLDATVGDGDAGSTFAAGGRAVLTALDEDRLSTGDAAALCEEVAAAIGRSMGGSSGVVLSILLTAAATRLREGDDLATALAAALDRLGEYGGAGVGERTMVDALAPAIEALPDGAAAVAEAARRGADSTAQVTSTSKGRSSYLGEDVLDGVVDPGAEAVTRALEAWAGAS